MDLMRAKRVSKFWDTLVASGICCGVCLFCSWDFAHLILAGSQPTRGDEQTVTNLALTRPLSLGFNCDKEQALAIESNVGIIFIARPSMSGAGRHHPTAFGGRARISITACCYCC